MMETYNGNGEELAVIEAEPQRGGMLDLASAANNLNALKIRHNIMVQATKQVLQDNVDFGKIPGTGDKPTLLKPGAEKLCFLFQLSPTFEMVDSVEDWDDGLFYYRYRCTLRTRDGMIIANAEGSCNSRETKYRYRNGSRKCPQCGQETIIKGKAQYGGGWLCFRKKGGCGAKFGDNDPQITGQQIGKVENPEPYELVNTLQKMAQKRAHVAATLIGTGASQFFTQDMEDLTVDAPAIRTEQPEPKQPKPKQRKQYNQPTEHIITDIKDVVGNGNTEYDGDTWPKFQRSVLKLLPYYNHNAHIVNTLSNAGIEKPWDTWNADTAKDCYDCLAAYAAENAETDEADEDPEMTKAFD